LSRHNGTLISWYHNLSHLGSLRIEKEGLQNQVLQLEQQVAEDSRIKQENAVLRHELNLSDTRLGLPQALGHVLVHGTDSLDRTYVIDIGSADRVQVGQAVLSQGYLVGRIAEVRPHSAVVRSIVSQKSTIQAWTNDSHEKGLLTGDGNAMYLSEVSQGAHVPDGTLVTTSGLGQSLPPNLLIGSIAGIRSAPNDSSEKFLIVQAIDSSTIETVFVVLTDLPS
jgi:rod shape-determining protein MreC